MKKHFAEAIGTFALVFCGTGAIIIDEQTHGAVTHVGVAITFGFIVMAMIYTFGPVSGAHLNPAVTLAFALAGRMDMKYLLPFMSSQLAGAFAATLLLKFLFPASLNLGSTLPAGSSIQSFILEIILSYLLMLVILQVSHGSKETGMMAGLAVGATVLLEAMFAGPISGASMNPARSLAPGIVSGNMNTLWIYVTAPLSGAILASLSWRYLFEKKT